jgi:hypothetical protein
MIGKPAGWNSPPRTEVDTALLEGPELTGRRASPESRESLNCQA